MSRPEYRRPKFLKPGDRDAESKGGRPIFEERLYSSADADPSTSTVYNNPYASLSIQQQRTRLPIFKNRNHILYLLEKYQTLIVVGETGCGKSTQVPQYLMEAGWAKDGRLIGITQPRRVAVVTLAARVADERMSILGHEVGYVVRFDDVTDASTQVKYMTDGILVRELMSDPLLTKYSVIMIDEAHERSINTDLLLGLLRKIITKRKDLRVIVSSATLDAEVFRDFFNLNDTSDKSKDTASIISVEGRMYPVHIFYSKSPSPDYVKGSVTAALNIHKTEPPGDILIFLTGQDEVEAVCQMLKDQSRGMKNVDRLWILPMYGSLPAREQLKVFDSSPHGTRKVVVATNIAEASVTIPGIACVIDCGFVKLRALNPKNGIESLMVLPVSQASAQQRAGRAGRIRPGKCYRLYPESEFEKLPAGTVPEVQRSHLAPVILQLKALGVENVLRFHYLSRPPTYAMIQGLELLYALGGIDHRGHLTNPLGMQMAEFPLPPMHAKTLLTSAEFGCSDEIATIIAMLQIQDVFITPSGPQRHKAEVTKRKFAVEEGDHLTMLNVFSNFTQNGASSKWCGEHFVNYRGLCRAADIRAQLLRLLKRYEVPIESCRGLIGETAKIRRCLVNGFFSHAAKLHFSGTYRTVKEDYPMKIYKGSTIMYRKEYPQWIIFNEVMQDSMRDISVIEPEWLYELAPHYYEYGTAGELASKRPRYDNMEDRDKANLN
uniref:RNA helicase n=1 Tax=Plectus sambesii TaxID=2011161 RepID=A0A914X0A8_9BILA